MWGAAVRICSDVAESPGWVGDFSLGVWCSLGPVVRRCPPWVDTQQSSETFGVTRALDVVRRLGHPHPMWCWTMLVPKQSCCGGGQRLF